MSGSLKGSESSAVDTSERLKNGAEARVETRKVSVRGVFLLRPVFDRHFSLTDAVAGKSRQNGLWRDSVKHLGEKGIDVQMLITAFRHIPAKYSGCAAEPVI